MKEIEIFIMIDEDGNHECATDADTAAERYEENDTAPQRRMIKVTLNVPLPKTIFVPTIDVPEDKLTIEIK